MPAVLPDGLAIAGVLPREDPLDAVVLPVSRSAQRSAVSDAARISIAALGQTPSIGTGSVRRIAQLTRLFPGARFAPIRGNLDTRLRKLDAGEYDALVLAAAGLRRLGFASRISLTLPAHGVRAGAGPGHRRDRDPRGRRRASGRSSADRRRGCAAAALDAERAVVEALGGGCQTPIGALAHAASTATTLELVAAVVVARRQPRRSARRRTARAARRARSARASARELLAQGAGDILAEARRRQAPIEQVAVES